MSELNIDARIAVEEAVIAERRRCARLLSMLEARKNREIRRHARIHDSIMAVIIFVMFVVLWGGI